MTGTIQRRVVQRVLGVLLMVFSTTMLTPIGVSLLYAEAVYLPFLGATLATALTGAALFFPVRSLPKEETLGVRDGFLVVTLFWIVLGLFGALPFWLYLPLGLDAPEAIFESMSGLTTTGATLITGLDTLPHAILFYRQQMQWLGGMGIIVLAVAILPLLGLGGTQLYRAETPGPLKDKLTPRMASTAKALWYIYLSLTIACAIAYRLAGMETFDAIGHSFSTVAIGGFSTHDLSIGYYDSNLIEMIAVLFMLISALNFGLHFAAVRRVATWWRHGVDEPLRAASGPGRGDEENIIGPRDLEELRERLGERLRRLFDRERHAQRLERLRQRWSHVRVAIRQRRSTEVPDDPSSGERRVGAGRGEESRLLDVYLGDEELRAFLALMAGLTVLTAVYLAWTGTTALSEGLIDGLFHVVSIGTTTGFTSTEYFLWPGFLPVLLLFASMAGGCAGSTGGGMKVIRVLLLFKQGRRELKRLLHPHAMILVKIGGRPVPDRMVDVVWGFLASYVALLAIMLLLLMATGLDQETAFSAVVACLNNLGPGLGHVAANYAGINDFSLIVLSVAMVFGRLEIFTLLVLFTPAFWRR